MKKTKKIKPLKVRKGTKVKPLQVHTDKRKKDKHKEILNILDEI